MTALRLAFAALLAAWPAWAAADDQVTTFALDNGIQVVVVEDTRAPVVTHMLWYRVGSADEAPGVSGVAHFLEHLMFKGTDELASGEFSSVVAANGGRDNAFTSYDYTGYFQRVASDRLGLMMQMEADRMTDIAPTAAEILSERGVILEERAQRTDSDPAALFREQMSAALYLNHGYGTPIIGWRHEMEELDMEDVMSFYAEHYAPNNTVLVVAGDVTADEVRALANEHYGVIPANPAITARQRTQEPPQRAERRLIFRDARVAQEYVTRSYIAPERDPGAQEKAAALTILAEILGGGTTSFLAEKLQFDTQTVVYVGAWYRGMSLDDTSFSLVVLPAPGVTLEEAEAAMDTALTEFMETGVDAEQLDRIKMQLRASQIYARDSADGVARRYGSALTSGLTVADVQAWPGILQAVTAEDIMQAAAEVLRPESSVTGYLTTPEAEGGPTQ
ncbi:MAG: pitrilysin family protein [Pseudomonadota bacterium]